MLLVPGPSRFWQPHELRAAQEAHWLDSHAPAPASDILYAIFPDEEDVHQIADAIDSYNHDQIRTCNRRASSPPLQTRPELNARLAKWGMAHIHNSEWGARLPFSILALLGVLAMFSLGHCLAGLKAGLFCAFILLSFPLFALNSRQIPSQIPLLCGAIITMLGLAGITKQLNQPKQPRTHPRPFCIVGYGLLAIGGLLLSHAAAGVLLGLFIPFASYAVACAMISEPRRSIRIIAIVSALAALTALVWTGTESLQLRNAFPGEHSLFGKTLAKSAGYISALGGRWQPSTSETPFNVLFEQIAFGMFPWIVLAPVALFSAAATAQLRNNWPWASKLALSWAIIAWITATFVVRNTGPIIYPALGAVALATGVWLSRFQTPPIHRKLIVLFGVLMALVLTKNLLAFPGKVAFVHILENPPLYPDTVFHRWPVALISLGFTASLGLGLWFRGYWPHCSIAIGIVFSGFVIYSWHPTLASHFASKNVFAKYHERKGPGNVLGIMGTKRSCVEHAMYIKDRYETLTSQSQVQTLLTSPNRVFAVIPRTQLCALHRNRHTTPYFVLDGSDRQLLLISNRIDSHDSDQNPLVSAIMDAPPTPMPYQEPTTFDTRIELIGASIPTAVERGKYLRDDACV